jgi:hypothetical protein
MYAFRVSINDEPPVVGGASDLGVLSAILTGAGPLGPDSVPSREEQTVDLSFRLGGLTSRPPGHDDEHLHWLDIDDLKVGDTVRIEIVQTDLVHPIEGGSRARQRADDEREYFEHCKRTYLELRSKYEVDGESQTTD